MNECEYFGSIPASEVGKQNLLLGSGFSHLRSFFPSVSRGAAAAGPSVVAKATRDTLVCPYFLQSYKVVMWLCFVVLAFAFFRTGTILSFRSVVDRAVELPSWRRFPEAEIVAFIPS